jgi:GntR family transcriptional repressor for pyruvate dehydrogenase complex
VAVTKVKQVEKKPELHAIVFEEILSMIVSGRYQQGARLPPERDLARQLGASRPTLREALRRLGEWRLIETRRSSGLVVRPIRDWQFDALPAYLRLGAPQAGARVVVRLIQDLLDVRRLVFVEVLRLVAPRVRPGALDEARRAVARAWAARSDSSLFLQEDFEFVRGIAAAAEFLPALWLLNSLERTYLALATMTSPSMIPDNYLSTYELVLNALERGDADVACRSMLSYLDQHDRRVMSALSEFAIPTPPAA